MNPSSKRFQKRVISSWTLAVEKVNLVFVGFCNMLVIDSNILQCHLVPFVSIYENTNTTHIDSTCAVYVLWGPLRYHQNQLADV